MECVVWNTRGDGCVYDAQLQLLEYSEDAGRKLSNMFRARTCQGEVCPVELAETLATGMLYYTVSFDRDSYFEYRHFLSEVKMQFQHFIF